MTHNPKHEATDAMGMESQRDDGPLSEKSGEAMSPIAKDAPVMVAWEAYRAGDSYQNTRHWASHSSHVDGSLWAAFEAGFRASRATTQPAEQSDGHPRDEQGRTAFEIIADANHEAAMVRAGIKDRSRDPLLGPPSDMVVSRVLLGEREDMSPKEADALAVKINDALSSLAAEQSALGVARHALNRIYLGHASSPKETALLALDDMDRAAEQSVAEERGAFRTALEMIASGKFNPIETAKAALNDLDAGLLKLAAEQSASSPVAWEKGALLTVVRPPVEGADWDHKNQPPLGAVVVCDGLNPNGNVYLRDYEPGFGWHRSRFAPYDAASASSPVEGEVFPGAGKKSPAHPDDLAVDRFAAAMKAKLAQKRGEGRGGWDDKEDCSAQFLSDLLRGHVEKGEPLDVGNFAMMLHQRGEAISAPSTTRSVAVSAEAVVALEPFALLVGYGDPVNATVNMDDPISKWLTVAQLQDAARVMNSLLNQARKPEGAEPVAYTNQEGMEHLLRHGLGAVTVWPTSHGKSTPFALYAHPAHEAGEIERLRKALERLSTGEAFDIPQVIDGPLAAELRMRMDFARAALEDKS